MDIIKIRLIFSLIFIVLLALPVNDILIGFLREILLFIFVVVSVYYIIINGN